MPDDDEGRGWCSWGIGEDEVEESEDDWGDRGLEFLDDEVERGGTCKAFSRLRPINSESKGLTGYILTCLDGPGSVALLADSWCRSELERGEISFSTMRGLER